MKRIFWSDYTTNELSKLIAEENPVVILPVGSTEQHGPHLTLNTDTDIGFEIAKLIAERSPIKTLVLPSVWTGFSEHHMDFCGTISFKQTTLVAVINDIVSSLIRHGITRIIILNSHGGNSTILNAAVNEIACTYNVSPIVITYWQLITDQINNIRKSVMGGMAHACELETSLKMLLSPKDVRTTLIEDVMITGDCFHNVDMFASNKINFYKPFKEWSKTGQIGAPSKASVKTGELILGEVLKKAIEFIELYWINNKVK